MPHGLTRSGSVTFVTRGVTRNRGTLVEGGWSVDPEPEPDPVSVPGGLGTTSSRSFSSHPAATTEHNAKHTKLCNFIQPPRRTNLQWSRHRRCAERRRERRAVLTPA